jgi:hypothetical protein
VPQALGAVALPEVVGVQVDSQHGRPLVVPNVAQKDAPDHLARLVFDRERDLSLALRNVLEPA